tara:strand:- start:523 stop:924 length:402 start_codon:yes stop_codon:yes gene_type:complete
MSIQLALLKSGEEVIADIKEFRDSEENLVSYLFKDPHCIKVKKKSQVLTEDISPKHEAVFYKWMSLSKDDDIVVNKDWVVCIVDPIESIEQAYSRRKYGGSNTVHGSNDGITIDGGEPADTNSLLNEQVNFTE